MGCHLEIDSLGFAFENFDELGLWRNHYKDGDKVLMIDPASTLADGRTLKDVAELKRLLLEREEQVARSLVEERLTYASGRMLTPQDRGEVKRIVGELKKSEFRVRDIIHHAAGSGSFLNL